MRNLKRTLSLVLAAAMLIGMMVVSASAASSDFTDSSEITNTEAVDVMTAIGVFEGTDKGAFNPSGILTREQAAKIIAVMLLGQEDADKLGTNSSVFKDVAADRWSAGYISYCTQQGILAGTGNGNFDPEGELTGLAFAKMLLVALGYDAKVAGYVGDDWSINVAADAVNSGIAPKGIVLSNAMTREQAAQMAFQTLTADTVYYTNKGTTVIGSDGTQVIVGDSAPVKVSANKSDDYRTVNDDRDEVLQFCEKYFSDLTLKSNATDAFGRPADLWKNGTKEIGTYSVSADASYTEEVNAKTLYSDLSLDKTITADLTEDGKSNGTFTIEKGNTANKLGGNGVLVEAFVKESGNSTTVSLVVINTYAGEISKVTAAKDGDPRSVTVDGLKYETEAFEVDDVVLYTKADGEIQTMALAEKVDGVDVTKTTGTSSFVANGETYKYSKTISASNKDDVKVDSVLDLYLDAYGYVIKVDVSKASSDYAYVVDTGNDSGRYDDENAYYAKLLLADGTVVEAEIDEDSLKGDKPADKLKDLQGMKNFIVEYTKSSKDIYTIKSVSKSALTSGNVEINKGEAGMKLGSATTNYYANSKTIFLVQSGTGSKATYAVYTGYANVPDLKANYGNYAVYCKTEGSNLATMVFISGVSASSDDIVYVLSSKKGTEVKDSDGTYYEYKAVVNGEITTIKMDERLASDGTADVLLNVIAYYDTDNEILDASECKEYSKTTTDDTYQLANAEVTAEAKDGVIGLKKDAADKTYAISDKVEVYAVTKGDKIETGVLADVEKGMTVTAIVKNGEVVSIFYGSKTSGGSTGSIKVSGVNGTVTMAEGSDDTTLRATVLGKEDGVYQILGAIPGNCAKEVSPEHLVYFKVTNKDAGASFTLTIYDSKGAVVYLENYKPEGGYAAGPVMAYVNVAAKTNASPNAGSGAYSAADFAAGTYTYSFTCGSTTARGTFTIG